MRCEKAFRNGTFKTKQYPIKIKIKPQHALKEEHAVDTATIVGEVPATRQYPTIREHDNMDLTTIIPRYTQASSKGGGAGVYAGGAGTIDDIFAKYALVCDFDYACLSRALLISPLLH